MFAFSEWNRLAPSSFLLESGPEMTDEAEFLPPVEVEKSHPPPDSFSEMFVESSPLPEENSPLDAFSEMFVGSSSSPPEVVEAEPSEEDSMLDSFSEMFASPPIVEESSLNLNQAEEKSKSRFYPMPLRLWISDTERKGIGYKGGYSTVGLLLGPARFTGNYLQMFDIRGHHIHMDDHIPDYAVNAGLVGRYIDDKRCLMYGGNIYYDFRQGARGSYNRLGLGTEVIGTRWDVRFNGYIVSPIDRKKKCVFDDFAGGYKATFHSEEIAYQGFNAEAGYIAAQWKGFFAYVAGGPYYLSSGSEGSAWGGLFRIRPQYRDYIALDMSISYDHLFNTNYQAKIILSWPIYTLGNRNDREGRCFSERQLFQPVERFEIIPLKRHCGWKTNW
jgi:hypothetical protein